MSKYSGTISRGIKLPIIKEGDDLRKIVVDTILAASKEDGFTLNHKDVIAITESLVARAQGNYCSVDDIATDIASKFNSDKPLAVLFPILSRNRFSIILRGIARGVAMTSKKIVLQLSYPSDEVGNSLITQEQLDATRIVPSMDVLDEETFRKLFGYTKHLFTGVDYIELYKDIIKSEGCEVDVIFGNKPQSILAYTDSVLTCDIHTRFRTKKLLEPQCDTVLCLSDILTKSVNGSGYNANYGLLGSNKATEERIKLFPRDSQNLVDDIQKDIYSITGKKLEVMVYGDGAFKDPRGKIWELADPVVSPFYTSGLVGTPNELKLKYFADNQFKDLAGDELADAVKLEINKKDKDLKGNMASQGTTPRQLTDLIGSLCDLTSGSGDKGTPVVLVQGYFDNFASN